MAAKVPRNKKLFNYADYERALRTTVNNEVKPGIVAALLDNVSDWDHQPEFSTRLRVEPDAIAIDAYPTGPNASIYLWVDKGTRPHVIRAKRPQLGSLSFQLGYSARTQPGRPHAGSGTASGNWAHAKSVNHPGTAPRNLTLLAVSKYEPDLLEAVQDAIDHATD